MNVAWTTRAFTSADGKHVVRLAFSSDPHGQEFLTLDLSPDQAKLMADALMTQTQLVRCSDQSQETSP
jgi:hypothetical protein